MKSVTKNHLSNETIGMLVKKNFGDNTNIVNITEFGKGAFNAVYLININKADEGDSEIVLKVSPKAGTKILTYEQDIIKTEVNVCITMKKAGVLVPKIFAYDFSQELIDADYFFMEKLQGEMLDSIKNRLSTSQMNTIKEELGKNAAAIHSVKGKYFGYIKESNEFHFESWQTAFKSFIENIIRDGKHDFIRLPYKKILKTLEPYWFLLDEITTPTLINFDMWERNIFIKNFEGEYHIEGIIDHERALFGDPLMEFVGSRSFINRDYIKEKALCRGYNSVAPKPIFVANNDRIRILMYNIYLDMIMAVEIYRYGIFTKSAMYIYSLVNLYKHLYELKKMEISFPVPTVK